MPKTDDEPELELEVEDRTAGGLVLIVCGVWFTILAMACLGALLDRLIP